MANLGATLSSDTTWGGTRLGAHTSDELLSGVRYGAVLSNTAFAPGGVTTEGLVRFAPETTGSEVSTLDNPSAPNIAFLEAHWDRVYSFMGYWDAGAVNRTAWVPSWGYIDSYAIYNPKHPDHSSSPIPDFSKVLAAAAPVTITGMSRSGTTITVTTSVNHGYANGAWIGIAGVVSTFNVTPNNAFQITTAGGNTFTITVSGLSSGTYTSGGTARRPLYINFGSPSTALAPVSQLPQYAADIGLTAWRTDVLAAANDGLSRGFVGIYLDDVNTSISVGFGDGTNANGTVYDPRTGATMTAANWTKYFADFMEYIRTNFTGEIVHNPVWFNFDHLAGNADQQRELAAADWIAIERGINDGGLGGGAAASGSFSVATLFSYVDNVHALGTGVYWQSYDTTAAGSEYNLAAYLLCSNGNDWVMSDYNRLWSAFWPGWDADLGSATGARSRSTTAGTVGLHRRNFTNGIVLLLEPSAATITNYQLGGTFYDLAGNPVTQVTLTAGTGRVFTGAPSFPVTSILDNANRADGAVGANWTTPATSGGNTLVISSNRFGGSGGNWPDGVWNTAFGARQETFCTVGATVSDDYTFFLRWQDVSNHYTIDFYGTTGEVNAKVAGVTTQIATFTTAALASGDVIGARIDGTVLTVWRNGVQVASVTNSGISAGGEIGMGFHASVGYADDFGGGTLP